MSSSALVDDGGWLCTDGIWEYLRFSSWAESGLFPRGAGMGRACLIGTTASFVVARLVISPAGAAIDWIWRAAGAGPS